MAILTPGLRDMIWKDLSWLAWVENRPVGKAGCRNSLRWITGHLLIRTGYQTSFSFSAVRGCESCMLQRRELGLVDLSQISRLTPNTPNTRTKVPPTESKLWTRLSRSSDSFPGTTDKLSWSFLFATGSGFSRASRSSHKRLLLLPHSVGVATTWVRHRG
jgi:hypothetical protein